MNAHDRRTVNRLRAFALPCAIATWTLLPAPPAEAQSTEEAIPTEAAPAETADTEQQTESLLGEEDVSVSDFMEVTLHVQDTELVKVLQMLSIQSQKNIITSPSVSAMVSADLYDVSFYEALDALLHVNGYGYQEKGNFIYVYTQEELAAMEEAAREPVTSVLELNYINAADASVFVTPALSDVGQISLNGPVQQGMEPNLSNAGQDDWAYSGKLVVRDYPENVEEIERIISELDTRPAQVLVEATIMQTTLTEENAFGVDFSIIADVEFDQFLTGPLGVVDSLRNGATSGGNGIVPDDNRASTVASTVGQTGGPGGFKVGVVNDDFSIFMRLLDEVTDSVILSNPKILCLNRQRARVQVGRNIGYLSTTATDTSTTQTVEFLPTGTTLTFRPFITSEGMIRMELAPRVSEGIIRDVTNASGATVTIPDEITQELTTNVLVRDGNTIVLGGLFRETTRLTKRQVPFLGDIPLVGAAFRGHEDATDRTEIVFMVRPTIVNDAVLVEQAERAMEYTDLARTGARRALLPWSEARLSAQWNQDAIEYARAGDYKQALWAVERSLAVDPTQPRALELREQLLNQRDRAEMPSILEDIYDPTWEEEILELEESIEQAKAEQKQRFQQAQIDTVSIWYQQNLDEVREQAQVAWPEPFVAPKRLPAELSEEQTFTLANALDIHMQWVDGPSPEAQASHVAPSCPILVGPDPAADEGADAFAEAEAEPQEDAAMLTWGPFTHETRSQRMQRLQDLEQAAFALAEIFDIEMRWMNRESHVSPVLKTSDPEAEQTLTTGEEADFFDSK